MPAISSWGVRYGRSVGQIRALELLWSAGLMRYRRSTCKCATSVAGGSAQLQLWHATSAAGLPVHGGVGVRVRKGPAEGAAGKEVVTCWPKQSAAAAQRWRLLSLLVWTSTVSQ